MLFTNKEKGNFAKDPAVVKFNGTYYLYYSIMLPGNKFGIGIAVSEDMEQWENIGEVLMEEEYEKNGIAAPGAIVLQDEVHLFYQTYGNWREDAICHAVSKDGVHFVKNTSNPVFAPSKEWCCGRAIDADVCIFNGKLYLYFATRDEEMKIQKVGGACAELDSGFGKGEWTELALHTLLEPELPWEGECIEAPATLVRNGKIYMFYGGSYNCTPQQIGCAVSEDGVNFQRVFTEPLVRCGAPDAWNSSESGHPYVFEDEDRSVILFYQGSADKGKTWYLSKLSIIFDEDGNPCVVAG